MSQTWHPNADHRRYRDEPAFLEERFGVRPAVELLDQAGVIGIARLTVMPAFSGESVYTLIYRDASVSVEAVKAEHSLWYSLDGGRWAPPTARTFELALSGLSPPLNRWPELKQVAQSAPSVHLAIVDGKEYFTLDGCSFRHQVVDRASDLFAEWHNPDKKASNHTSQVILLRAYNPLLAMAGEPEYEL